MWRNDEWAAGSVQGTDQFDAGLNLRQLAWVRTKRQTKTRTVSLVEPQTVRSLPTTTKLRTETKTRFGIRKTKVRVGSTEVEAVAGSRNQFQNWSSDLTRAQTERRGWEAGQTAIRHSQSERHAERLGTKVVRSFKSTQRATKQKPTTFTNFKQSSKRKECF